MDLDREQHYSEFVARLTRHDQSIRRFVRSLLPSPDGIDDIVQDAVLECWKRYSEFRPSRPEDADDEFIRWACVIARYKAMSWQRDRARDRLVFRESVIERLAEAAMTNLERHEVEQSAIESCLEAMTDENRRLVLSVHVPGESIAAIAEETGEVARRLYSKVNKLRRRLLECVQQRLASETANG